MQNEFAVAGFWPGAQFSEEAITSWAEQLRAQLKAPQVSLGLIFISPELFSFAPQILELVRLHARIPLLLGCSSTGLIAGDTEIEQEPGVAVGLYFLPGAILRAVSFTPQQVDEFTEPASWHTQTGVAPSEINGWLIFADPFHMDCEEWLQTWNAAYAPLPVVGGLASGKAGDELTQLYLNGDVLEEGGVALAVGGTVELTSIISQGCTPIGETWTITKAERNFIHEIGNRPAYEVLAETFNSLSAEEQKESRGNLFVGLVTNEYQADFHRGDFLVRNLIGADPRSGIIAVGAIARPGQTVQFQRRDAATASEDIGALLERTVDRLAGRKVYGACLCCCNGRGYRLFGEKHHDARQVRDHLGPIGLTGFFCNGEIGPVGEKNFLHGYTASVGLFVEKKA